MAAAALCIGVGSFSDPEEVPGLAHFLEHMVFMGNEKYPAENSFDEYIQRRGGYCNALTDCERTIFYFEIHKKHFGEALARFAEFFISPLMRKSSVDKEIQAVDSEFQSSLNCDSNRTEQLLGTFAVKGHPMGKFMWGNIASLKTTPMDNNIDVYSQLTKFKEQHYSSSCMTLAIQSQENLDTLEKWVNEIFHRVPNNGSTYTSFIHSGQPFNTSEFCRIYKIVSVGSSNLLTFNWAFSPMAKHYKEKPLTYLLFLFGHEGNGSLLSYLKQKVWALNLWTEESESGFETNSTYTLCSFTIELTDIGLDHLYEVLTATFTYIDMIKKAGPQEKIFEEIQWAATNEFKWREEESAVDYVEKMSVNMQIYPPEHYITGDCLMSSYNASLIEDCLKLLTPDRVNIMVLSQSFESQGICNLEEKWYQTAYCSSEIDTEWLKEWRNPKPNPAFYIPVRNEFIATDFTVITDDSYKVVVPTVIHNEPRGRLWYKQDIKFKVPKGYIVVHLGSPIAASSVTNAVLTELFVSVLQQNLKEDVYPALLAMLEFKISFDKRGLIISVNGFNHKLRVLLETIINHIVMFDVTDELFEAVRSNIIKYNYNIFIKPQKMARDIQCAIVHQVSWTPMDRNAALDKVTKEMLLKFVEEFKGHLYIECLCQGNLSSDESKSVFELLMAKLNYESCALEKLSWNRTIKLPRGQSSCRVSGLNPEDGISVVLNYYQLMPATIYTACLMELVNDFMEEPCFDYLRTKEQLGYNVYCLNCLTNGVIGFGITVHSSADKFSCSEVDTKIEEFLSYFRNYLSGISEEEFEIQVTSLIKAKQHPDLYLKEEIHRNASEIFNGYYVFDRLEKEVKCLQTVTRSELIEWFCMRNEDSGFNKLSIQIVGMKTGDKSDSLSVNSGTQTAPQLQYLSFDENEAIGCTVISDFKSFKDQLDVFPNVLLTS
ncbi:hypothetical protein CHUAL_004574 [Chamberlinius hualienensis]